MLELPALVIIPVILGYSGNNGESLITNRTFSGLNGTNRTFLLFLDFLGMLRFFFKK